MNQHVKISVIAGWGSVDYDVVAGVVGSGGLEVQVESPICKVCSRSLKSGELVGLLTFVDSPNVVHVYHLEHLPDEFEMPSGVFSKVGSSK